MIVLDAYAVLALLKDEPAASEVNRLLQRNETSTLTAPGVAEVVDYLVRLVGVTEEEAALDVAQLGLGDPDPLEVDVALGAGFLEARHYDRQQRAVSLADCVVAETARRSGAVVASADPHLLDLCRAEAIAVEVLPDTRGRRWTP